MDVDVPGADQFAKHRERSIKLLEDPVGFGRLAIYCVPDERVRIPMNELKTFLENQRGKFSEVLRYFPEVKVFHNGVYAGYAPRAVRQDIKDTALIALLEDGLVAWDSQADMLMDKDSHLHPYWLSYEVQRLLQLATALLETRGVKAMRVFVELQNIEQFRMRIGGQFPFDQGREALHRRPRAYRAASRS